MELSFTCLDKSWGLQEVEAPRVSRWRWRDCQPYAPANFILPPPHSQDISPILISVRGWVDHRAISVAGRNRIRDLPACTTVPQTTVPLRIPSSVKKPLKLYFILPETCTHLYCRTRCHILRWSYRLLLNVGKYSLRNEPRLGAGVSGAVQGTAGYRWEYRTYIVERDSAVGIVTCYGPDAPGSNPGEGETFRIRLEWPWGSSILLYFRYRGFFHSPVL
jgi:hypothetical protein